jgi:hypothetical protein
MNSLRFVAELRCDLEDCADIVLLNCRLHLLEKFLPLHPNLENGVHHFAAISNLHDLTTPTPDFETTISLKGSRTLLSLQKRVKKNDYLFGVAALFRKLLTVHLR